MSLEDCKPAAKQNPPSISDIQDQIRSTCEDIRQLFSTEKVQTSYDCFIRSETSRPDTNHRLSSPSMSNKADDVSHVERICLECQRSRVIAWLDGLQSSRLME